jgi:hypothetical protein
MVIFSGPRFALKYPAGYLTIIGGAFDRRSFIDQHPPFRRRAPPGMSGTMLAP